MAPVVLPNNSMSSNQPPSANKQTRKELIGILLLMSPFIIIITAAFIHILFLDPVQAIAILTILVVTGIGCYLLETNG